MKRSPRTRKTCALSESISRQLNMYALAASAAGVGALALTQQAEGKVVYTRIHKTILTDGRYLLDLNHDGVSDFILSNILSLPYGAVEVCPNNPGNCSSYQSRTQPNEIWGNLKHPSWASALPAGVKIGPNLSGFMPRHFMMAAFPASLPVVPIVQIAGHGKGMWLEVLGIEILHSR